MLWFTTSELQWSLFLDYLLLLFTNFFIGPLHVITCTQTPGKYNHNHMDVMFPVRVELTRITWLHIKHCMLCNGLWETEGHNDLTGCVFRILAKTSCFLLNLEESLNLVSQLWHINTFGNCRNVTDSKYMETANHSIRYWRKRCRNGDQNAA